MTSLLPTSGGVVRALSLLALLMCSGLADGKIVYVNKAVKTPGKGTSWSTAYKYLRDALDTTKAGDEIYVAKGIYYPDDGATGIFGDREMSFDLKGQKIYGGFTGKETSLSQRKPSVNITVLSGAIWDGPNASDYWSLHIVTVAKNSTLDGVIVEDGHANGGHSWNYPSISSYDRGGGCYVKSGNTLTLANCIFRDNRALADGGAIMVEDGVGKVVATKCTFERNAIPGVYRVTYSHPGGGAIKGDVEATDCRFVENTIDAVHAYKGTESAAFGGAISGNVKAVRCEFTANKAYAHNFEEVEPTSDGGAIYGNFSGTDCAFTRNESFATDGDGISSGGAISGGVINAFNCTFVENMSGTAIGEEGKPVEEEEGEEGEEEEEVEPVLKAVPGGGGAIHASGGESQIANCVFVRNSSLFRGGAVQAGVTTGADSIFISNCTFLDNAVVRDGRGAALSGGGVVRLLNSIFWFTEPTSGTFDLFAPVHVSFGGALRNSDEHYPTPSSAAPNILKGGTALITRSDIPNIYLVSPSLLILDSDPLFANVADLDGADNRWGTADDGLRLKSGSPAIGKALDPRITGFNNLLPKDLTDVDGDGDVAERLPTDLKGNVRVQNTYVEIGAYEYGSLKNSPEIAVFEGKKELFDGGTRSSGDVLKWTMKEMTFTIRSSGTSSLGNISVALSGDREFSMQKMKTTSLEPGSKATFTVIFKPNSAGKYSAKLRISSNDANESPFDITLTGNGTDKKKSSSKVKASFLASAGVATSKAGSTAPSAFVSTAGSSGAVVTRAIAADGTKHLVLTVLKSDNWTGGTVEVSSDLLKWYSGTKHTTLLEDSATLLRVRDNTAVSNGEKRFIRLK